MKQVTLRIGQRFGETDAGRKRRRNEDAFVCDPPLFAVADGMGGAQAGEIASSQAVAALTERSDNDSGGETRVIELIQEANRRVHQRALDDAAASGMGTTMTVALFGEDGTVTIGHVGDSRAYVLREGRLEQLTDDHSLVAELVRRGELSPEEAEVHPQRSVITRALGTDPDVDVDAFPVEARAGDIFLLCSDGLTTMVDGDGIADLVERHREDLRRASAALIDAANDRGGDDNITAVLFEIVDGAGAAPHPDEAGSPDEDDIDTLHPEDRVAAPVLDEPVVDEAAPAIAAPMHEERAPAAEEAAPERVEKQLEPPSDTVIVRPEELQAATAVAEPVGEPAPVEEPDSSGHPGAAEEERARLPLVRMALSTLVILILSAVIVLLVMRGLAR
jgi:serine/threonine protein phosphatase PrpC